MFSWQVILKQILGEFLSPCAFANMCDNRTLFFFFPSIIKSSDSTLLGLFRGTWKGRMMWPRFFIIILQLLCRGNDAVLQRGMFYHPLQIASSVEAGVILWLSSTYRRLYYNSNAHHTAADGSGSISIITLHYQVEKSRLGEKNASRIKTWHPGKWQKVST